MTTYTTGLFPAEQWAGYNKSRLPDTGLPCIAMKTLFNLRIDDEGDRYRVTLGVQADRLVFQCEDGTPEVLAGPGPLYVASVLRPTGHFRDVKLTPHRRVIYIGDLDVPGAEHVEIDGIWVPILRSPSYWPRPYFMTGPRDFTPEVVTAKWQSKRRLGGWRTLHSEQLRLKEWGAEADG